MVETFRLNTFAALHLTSKADTDELAVKRLGLPNYPKLDRAGRISEYLSQYLPLTALIEDAYVDKDWTSLLSLHYAGVFGQFPRGVVRVHLFRGLIPDGKAILESANFKDDYLGFFTVYPSRPKCVGRSLLDVHKLGLPGALWCRNEVHLAGVNLTAHGFPFSGQDGKVMCCAHIAMWDIIRYYSTKYGFYGEYHQGDIAQLCEDARIGRAIPTHGLYYAQILAGFSALRIRPAVYSLGHATGPDYLQWIARGYLRSGIPVILAGDRHAIAAVGLIDPDKSDSDIIVNDDNFFPYGHIAKNSTYGCRFSLDQLEFVFVPLYSKIVVPYETADRMASDLRQNSQWGCAAKGLTITVEQRTFLTSSKTYKEALTGRPSAGMYEAFARTAQLPKFVWVTELFEHGKPDAVVAEYIVDATTSEYDETAFLLLRYASGFYHNGRFANAASDENIEFWSTPGSPPNWERFPGNLNKIP